ncbi:hypothetical protein FRC01_001052 [Tulasnella sp. 417]|nr:hypothetical protein FRC01_001052 [Tulasnella sp. 417]
MKRRRSMSPPYAYDRERYDARPRYDEYHDYRGGPPPGRYSPPHGYRAYSPPRARGPVNPYDMDYPATFRQFTEWYRYNHPGQAEADPNAKNPDGTPVNPFKKPYDEYRKAFTSEQLRILFDHHKRSAWFIERYSPAENYAALRTRTRKLGWAGRIDEFMGKLEGGQFDPPKLELDATPPPLSAAIQRDQPKEATSNGTEGGADPAANGNGSTAAAENGNAAPGDVDMDETRAEDEMDINMYDGEGGNEMNGAGDADAAAAKGARDALPADAQVTAEEVSVEPEGVQIMIRTIPPDLGRVKIEEVDDSLASTGLADVLTWGTFQACQKIPGFMYLALGDPMQKRNYYRCGWIRFEDDVDVPEVISKLGEEKLDGFRMQLTHSTRPFVAKMRMAPGSGSRPERIVVDLEKIKKLASLLEEQAEQLAQLPGDDNAMEPPTEPKDRGSLAVEARAKHLADMLDSEFPEGEEEKMLAKKNAMAFDLYLAYVRYAFNCCYYCAAITDFHEELLRNCTKLFKAEAFVEKHIANKHPEVTRDVDDLPFFNNFALDPHRIQPFTHAPPPTGNQQPPPQAYGLRAPQQREQPGGRDYTDPYRYPYQPNHHYPPAPPPISLTAYGEYPPPRDSDGFYRRRERSPPSNRRRLSDRLGDRVHDQPPLVLTGSEGLPAKPSTTFAEPMSGAAASTSTPPPGPPPKVKEDPRASAGRKISYMDMDEVAEGDVELSASLWAVLELLQQHKTTHPQIDIKFDSSNPVSSPVVVHVRPHLDLLFSPLDQRLTLINIRKLRSGHALILKYRDKTISSTSTTTGNGTGTVFRKSTVSQVFGPTYQGDVMRYPGIWFGFEEDGTVGHVGVPTHLAQSPEERNQEVKRIVVTQRTDPDEQAAQEKDALDEAIECPEMYGDLKKAYVKLDTETGFSTIELSFHLPPSASPSQTAPVEIRIGETTAQDLIAEIGSPPRVHYKEDDRMLIHKSAAATQNGEDDDSEGYFYNYFQYGMDILISGSTHVVQKVILHSNVPGSHLFQRYKRCPWEIEVPVQSSSRSPPSIAMPLPSLIDNSTTIEPPASKGGKKGRKKTKGVSPEPLIDIHPDVEPLPEVEQVPGGVETVSLFTKVDHIKGAFGPSLAQNQNSRPMAIPIASPKSPSVPQTPRSAISRQFAQLAMSTSPPTMVLDRSSETGNPDTTSSVGGTTQLMGFDGMVLEVSELGDVLSVVIF